MIMLQRCEMCHRLNGNGINSKMLSCLYTMYTGMQCRPIICKGQIPLHNLARLDTVDGTRSTTHKDVRFVENALDLFAI